ncbi:phosphomevalonate kinase [Streptomyces roseirectus]|uniref:phosphomevalonate kinase n=1 Tax=Streptomyces roseirectus TaxID=2768066 RepID=A0A7H0IPK7_9ACTN|nr:phosphomevalonate kinase [Streptomyces roseirectus]QNP74723.1 phosphomevalonate kinase [Streptomyces roseirectus]
MTAGRTVTRRAPGKLFVAGEYAVLEPGRPAILTAVDRHVSVTVSPADGPETVIETDLGPPGTRPRPVVEAIDVVDGLLAERGRRPSPVRVSIVSRLHRAGTKFGLGSSGAVTVATVDAVAAHHGLELSPGDRFRLALLATARRDPRASGGDLAASVWGGWVAYRAPDRTAVLALARSEGIDRALRAPWPGLAVTPLPPPRALALEVGWTGEPASTSSLTARLETGQWRGSPPQRAFLEASDTCVRAAIRALERGDDDELLHQVRRARRILADLDDAAGLGIFTPGLTALCDAAEAVGGAAKPSGAGGGDCGIALLDATAAPNTARLHQRWAAAGIRPLPIHPRPTTGSTP